MNGPCPTCGNRRDLSSVFCDTCSVLPAHLLEEPTPTAPPALPDDPKCPNCGRPIYWHSLGAHKAGHCMKHIPVIPGAAYMDRGLLKALVTAGMAAQSCDPAIPHAANFGQAPATESPTPIGVMADNKVLAGVNVQLAEQVTELERELAQAESTAAELRGALEKAKQAIRDLAQSGTERIRELGAECDPWEKTAGIAIRQAGLEEALAQPREGGSGKYASPVDEVERLKGALERIRRDSDSCDDAWEILARIGNIASDALQPLPPAGGKGGGK